MAALLGWLLQHGVGDVIAVAAPMVS